MSVMLESKLQHFELDTGSPVRIMALTDYQQLNLQISLRPTSVCFRTYTKEIFELVGVALGNITFNGTSCTDYLYVVDRPYSAILRRL